LFVCFVCRLGILFFVFLAGFVLLIKDIFQELKTTN